MSGIQLPQGGAPGFGGSGYANTQQAVAGPNGTLEAYNPNTMARTLKPPPAPLASAAFSGMSTQGVPDFVSNWLAQGGTGTMPTRSSMGDLTNFTDEAGAGTAAGVAQMKDFIRAKGTKDPHPGQDVVKKTTTAGGIGAPAGASAPGLTMIPMNAQGGYNPAGTSSGGVVSDQWNGSPGQSAGTSLPTVSAPLGGNQNSPSIMGGPIYTDGKGGFFNDPAGTKPLTGVALQAAQRVFGSMGYK